MMLVRSTVAIENHEILAPGSRIHAQYVATIAESGTLGISNSEPHLTFILGWYHTLLHIKTHHQKRHNQNTQYTQRYMKPLARASSQAACARKIPLGAANSKENQHAAT